MPVDEFGNEMEEEGGEEQEHDESPKFATVQDLAGVQQLLQNMQQQMSVIATSFSAVTAQRQATGQPAEPAIEDLSDEELDEIVASGQGGKKLRQAIRAAESRVRREVNELQTVGLGAISNVVRDMSMRDMPYYDKYQDEIEGILKNLAPQALLDPLTYKRAYAMVMGQHLDEVVEDQIQQRSKPRPAPQTNMPGGVNGRTRGREVSEEDDEDLMPSNESRQALRSRGLDPDSFARQMGYKSWKDYAKAGEGSIL